MKIREMHRNLPWVWVLFFYLCASCGGSTPKKAESFNPLQPRDVFLPLTPENYALADGSCASLGLSLDDSLYIQQTSLLIDTKTPERQNVTFADLRTNAETTRTNYVIGLERGGRYLLSCDERNADHNCQDNHFLFQQLGNGEGFLICRDNFAYPEESLEFVSLSSLYFLEQAKDVFMVNFPDYSSETQNFPVKLLVFPDYQLKMTYTSNRNELITATSPLTDNMAYSPKGEDGERKFIVYPASKEVGYKLWRSPFVIHHEFGHYIEDVLGINPCLRATGFFPKTKSLGERRKRDKLDGSRSSLSLQNLLDFEQEEIFNPDNIQAVQHNFCGGLSEGFADLIAYLGLQGDVDSLSLLGENSLIARSPSSTVFANGIAKELTLKVFYQLSQEKQTGGEIEAHDLGAITAHIFIGSLQRLFAIYVQTEKPSREQLYRLAYQLTISWHKSLTQVLASKKTIDASAFFSFYKQSILDVFAEYLDGLDAKQGTEEKRLALSKSLCSYLDSVVDAPDVGCVF